MVPYEGRQNDAFLQPSDGQQGALPASAVGSAAPFATTPFPDRTRADAQERAAL